MVGLITDARQAKSILSAIQADCVALGHTFNDDPRWPWHAAGLLGEIEQIRYPRQCKQGGWSSPLNLRTRDTP
ncbi:hypothetical protein [Caballeronia sp. HLA56]